jgi:chitin disaccharide deacetylase
MTFTENKIMKTRHVILTLFLLSMFLQVQAQETYAEKLGFPKGSKVLILHVDDVGMSWDSNTGAINATEKGIATSMSIMMPCPWVPGFFHYMETHKNVDAGLHLTLTSEWRDYRWAPLSGVKATPGLVDKEGAMWSTVEDVVKNATADEVEAEIRAQVERSLKLGWTPTHLDSHMGTLFAKPEFLQRYIKVGIEYKIPVMFFGGHSTLILEQLKLGETEAAGFRQVGTMLWGAGLPVLDDLHNFSYEFNYPKDKVSDQELQKFATSKYIETLKKVKPGLTMVIMHCTKPSEVFPYITDSGNIRKGDLLAMMDPELKKFVEKEGFILTTWREVMARRQKVK